MDSPLIPPAHILLSTKGNTNHRYMADGDFAPPGNHGIGTENLGFMHCGNGLELRSGGSFVFDVFLSFFDLNHKPKTQNLKPKTQTKDRTQYKYKHKTQNTGGSGKCKHCGMDHTDTFRGRIDAHYLTNYAKLMNEDKPNPCGGRNSEGVWESADRAADSKDEL